MQILFGFQDVLEYVTTGLEPLPERATDAKTEAYKEANKKDFKAWFLTN